MTVSHASRSLAVAAAAALAAVVGCHEKKSDVEKRAEEMARANASVSALAAASASAPDPGEQKFAATLKLASDRLHAFMVVLQDVERSAGAKADLDKLREFFAPGADGQKLADKVGGDATFSGKQGVPVVDFDLSAHECDLRASTCSASVWEKQSQRGKFVCYAYKLTFALQGDQLYWKDKTIPIIVPCERS